MSKKTALWVILIAAAVEVGDKASGGKIFGPSGILQPIDALVPKLTIAGITTDIAIWAMLVGAAFYFL